MANVYRDCSECTKEFYITDKAQAVFKKFKQELPKRCFDCREKIKARKNSPFSPIMDELKKDKAFMQGT